MRKSVLFLFVTPILAVPAVALAYINLNSAGSYLWDIAEPSDYSAVGSLSNGTGDAYDTCYQLAVGGTVYDPESGTPLRTLADRQIEMPVQTIAGLEVKRIIYVPPSGGDYARFLEVLENTSSSAVSTTITVSGNLGSDSGTNLTGTSSGSLTVSVADIWFATDDSDGSGDPSLAHVFQGTSSSISPSAVSLISDNISYSWNVTVPARSRIAIMHFAVQAASRAASIAEARRLVETPDDALVGVDDYLDEILNFGVSSPGAPRVRFTGPFSADEGSEIVLDVSIEDLEGDTYTFSWDLDDDGTFDEAPGVTSYTIAAGTTDGPGLVRVGIRATDSEGNTAERRRSVQILNVDPQIASDPPRSTSVGVNFRYAIIVDDPAGELDEMSYTLARGPARMTVTPGGVVQWSPADSDVTMPGETLTIEVTVDDGDEGSDSQVWEMTVSPNRAPSPAVPAFPIDNVAIIDPTPRLAASNGQDLDLDTLIYQFQIDTLDTFDSPDLRSSGPMDETPGFTAWQITEPLPEGRLYYWRVWANDGTVDSEVRQTSFYVVRDPSLGPPDAGPPDGGARSDGGFIPGIDAGLGSRPTGCSCRAGAGSPLDAGGLGVALAALALCLRRRR